MNLRDLWQRIVGPFYTTPRTARRRPDLALEVLEGREVPAAFTPTLFTDSAAAGANTLRNAVRAANTDASAEDAVTLAACRSPGRPL